MNNDNVKRAIDRHLDKMDKEEQIMVMEFIYRLEEITRSGGTEMSREELINRTVAALTRMYYEDVEFICHFAELILKKKGGKS